MLPRTCMAASPPPVTAIWRDLLLASILSKLRPREASVGTVACALAHTDISPFDAPSISRQPGHKPMLGAYFRTGKARNQRPDRAAGGHDVHDHGLHHLRQPAILADAGMDRRCVRRHLAAAFGSAFMGLYASYSVSGMGSMRISPMAWSRAWAMPGRRRWGRCSCPHPVSDRQPHSPRVGDQLDPEEPEAVDCRGMACSSPSSACRAPASSWSRPVTLVTLGDLVAAVVLAVLGFILMAASIPGGCRARS